MPELPEVEIVCRNLAEMIGPREKITGWNFFRKDLRFKIPQTQLKKLKGLSIHRISRRAKYILFHVGEHIIISHLGMTGSWRLEGKAWGRNTHDHLAFQLGPDRFFVYQDPRRFGFIEVVPAKQLSVRFAALGVEPLETATDFKVLTETFRTLGAPIKNALMNQNLIVGVGNIYACEGLFRAGVSPFRKASAVRPEEYARLWRETRILLEKAILKGGSTIDNYRNSFGESGGFQTQFFVYGREQERCLKCESLIKRKVQAGRSSFWCSGCQK